MSFSAFMSKLKRWYFTLHLVSIDTVLGACSGMYFFAELLRVDLDFWQYCVLGLAVWAIYTMDHLVDARTARGKHLARRHRFHQKNFKFFCGLLLVAVGVGLFLVWYIIGKTDLLVFGAAVALLMAIVRVIGVFFFHSLPFYKEISIAVFYTVGITLAPLIHADIEYTGYRWVYFVFAYWGIASFNLLFLSLLDLDTDRAAAFTSAPLLAGVRITRVFLTILSLFCLLLLLSFFIILPSFYHRFTLILLLIFMFHLRAFMERPYETEWIRIKLEAVFLLPFVLLFFK